MILNTSAHCTFTVAYSECTLIPKPPYLDKAPYLCNTIWVSFIPTKPPYPDNIFKGQVSTVSTEFQLGTPTVLIFKNVAVK